MPISSIDNFISNLDKYNGPAMSDRFYVNFTVPVQIPFGNVRDLQYQCETTELPGISLGLTDYRTYGPSKKIASNTEYSPISFNIYCTNEFWEKPLFDTWIEYINPRNIGWDFRFKDEYSTSILITQIDQSDNIIYQVALNKAFPFQINPMSLSWSGSNIHQLNVSFAYDNYEPQLNRNYLFNNLSASVFGDQQIGNQVVNPNPIPQSFISNNPFLV